MYIRYETNKIKRLFDDSDDYRSIRKKIGQEKAKSLKKIMNRLESAPCFNDILLLNLGGPHRLNGDLDGCYALSISANYRLVLIVQCVENQPDSLKHSNEVIVKGVVDYHGEKNNWIIP